MAPFRLPTRYSRPELRVAGRRSSARTRRRGPAVARASSLARAASTRHSIEEARESGSGRLITRLRDGVLGRGGGRGVAFEPVFLRQNARIAALHAAMWLVFGGLRRSILSDATNPWNPSRGQYRLRVREFAAYDPLAPRAYFTSWEAASGQTATDGTRRWCFARW